MTKGFLEFDFEKCKGCNLCVQYCPKDILYQDLKTINNAGYNVIKLKDAEQCIGCGFCAVMCPDSVITVKVEKK